MGSDNKERGQLRTELWSSIDLAAAFFVVRGACRHLMDGAREPWSQAAAFISPSVAGALFLSAVLPLVVADSSCANRPLPSSLFCLARFGAFSTKIVPSLYQLSGNSIC